MCVYDFLGGHLPYPGAEAAIVIQSGSNVPTINTIGDPGLARIQILMYENVCAMCIN